MSKIAKTALFLFCAPALVSFLTACNDFSNVQKLGKRGETIQAASDFISKDFLLSCMRRAKTPSGKFPAITTLRDNDEKICLEKYQSASDNISEYFSVFTLYLNRLAVISNSSKRFIEDSDRDKLDKAFQNLLSSFNNINVQLPSEVATNSGVFGRLVSLVFDIMANDIRKQTILPVMICTNDEIQQYSEGLEKIVSVVYINALNDEKTKYDTYFTNLAPRDNKLESINLPSEMLVRLELDNKYNEKIDLLNQKKETALEFANMIKSTRKLHSDISAVLSSEKFNIEEMKTDSEKKKAEAKKIAFCEKFKKKIVASEDMKLTSEQSRKIIIILNKYHESTKYLLKNKNFISKNN